MKLGIVGLPNVGKSTLFNSMTMGKAEAQNYPFCTIEPNVGIVAVPDERLNYLTKLYNSAKTTPAVIEFVDIAGLVKGASKGEGLGNKFLSHIREVDAIVHVVRCFEDPNVIHVEGSVNPIRDIETINYELIFSDMEIIERRIAKTQKLAKLDKAMAKELEILLLIQSKLESGKSPREIKFDIPEDREFAESLNLLTYKPVLYAANVPEEDIADAGNSNKNVQALRELVKKEGSEVFIICAKIEEELSQLSSEEKLEFLNELGTDKSGLERLITASYKLLGLISYLTAGPTESRAWTIKEGTKAPQAAGKIHSDFERGFIRAEVVAYDDLKSLGSYTLAKEKGLVRSEGKEYVVKDGDVVLFRFNV
ncbi:MAG: redox-regulated ATPase YchF [Lachnospiraceae bacterium]|nr:redox-regulated ATPase YchF [Lachnospiraceae bacterium]